MSTAMKKELAKAKKIVHPNSRKSAAISKRTRKITNREKAKMGSAMKQNLIGEKMLWIKEHMVPDVCPYTSEMTAELLEKYMSRYDEELEQIDIKHSVGNRKNRQHASREDIIRLTMQREREEYVSCGIEIPDILNPPQCEMLRKWDGGLRYLPNFKFRRFGKKHLNEALKKLNKPPKEPKLQTKEEPKAATKEEGDGMNVKNENELSECSANEKSQSEEGAMDVE